MTESTGRPAPAGWYPDGQGGVRWWDGERWTEDTPPPPTQPQAQPQAQAERPARTGPALAVAGAAAVIIGSLIPWATLTHVFGSASLSGIEGDGVITLVLGGVLLIGAILQLTNETSRHIWTEVVAAVTLIVAVLALINMLSNIGDADSEYARASVGPGLYLVVAGAAIALIGTDMTRRTRNNPPTKNTTTSE